MTAIRLGILGAALVLAIAACGGQPTAPANAPAAPAAPASGVQWADYNPALRSQIDSAKDCPDLQVMFDNADANGPATQSRTGHNNAELMGYIDAAMRTAGCYK